MRKRSRHFGTNGEFWFLGAVTGILASLLGGCRVTESPPADERNQLAVSAAIVTTTLRDASGRIEIRIKACDPTAAAATNCAYCTADDGWARIGGGAQILGEASGGAMLQASYPDPNYFTAANANGCTGPAGFSPGRLGIDNKATWVVRASGATHQLQAYVIEMRLKGNDGVWFQPWVSEGRDAVSTAVNPPANFQSELVESEHAALGEFMIGGGAYLYRGDDNIHQATATDAYLVGSYPVDGAKGRAWRAIARSRSTPAPDEGLKAFGLFTNICPDQMAPKCLSYPVIKSITAAAVSGYGTASLAIPEFEMNSGVGGYAPVSSGGVRYLADLIPFNGSGQGFTVRSKAYGTGTGQTIGYAMTFGIPHDVYTAIYNHSNKCMGVLSARLDATAPLAQQTCTYGNEPANLRFAMVPQSGGYVALKFEHSGMCLDVSGASTANSAAAIQYPCSYADNQLVQLLNNATGGHSFKFKHSGKCLDVTGASTADGARFVQYTCNGQANQAFHFDD
jgi:hypothetical protein